MPSNPTYPLSVAPMMGCTDRHCRYLLRLVSPNALLYSEMVTSGALLHGSANHFLRHEEDAPCVFQLGGSNPTELSECAELVEAAGYQAVNLNVGCPSDRVQSAGIGACLMATPKTVANCVSAMAQRVNIPVSVKCRIGIDQEPTYAEFRDFIHQVYDGGCRSFSVHARIAVLSGLSPKQNREIPPLHYDFVYRIKDDFPDAQFSLNGGIKTHEDALMECQRVGAVMIGRAVYNNPFLLAQLDASLFGSTPPDHYQVWLNYRDHIASELAAGENLKHSARHLLGLFSGLRGARAFRRNLGEHIYIDGADLDMIDETLETSGVLSAIKSSPSSTRRDIG